MKREEKYSFPLDKILKQKYNIFVKLVKYLNERRKTMQETNEKMKKEERLIKLFQMMKAQNALAVVERNMTFNHTELRMISEILSAKYDGKRLISTQLASILGITRSAISQIVNRLEQDGVVKRVPDEVDRKIAYVEISPSVLERYGKEIQEYSNFITNVVEEFGEENFDKMHELFIQFTSLMQGFLKK